MYLLGKYIDALNGDDLIRLIDNRVQENRRIEYKRELQLQGEKEWKEFICDIAAMHNAEGGCILYGIEEEKSKNNTGVPRTISGIQIDNLDKLVQQIESRLKSNTNPPIHSIKPKVVEIDDKKVLIIGVSGVLGLPTMVTLDNRFYGRRNSGRYLLDVYELNQMFLNHSIIREQVETFRRNRIGEIRRREIFPMLTIDASYVIHIVPYSFLREQSLDFANLSLVTKLLRSMAPISSDSGYSHHFNIDGIATSLTKVGKEKHTISYNQFFRNGIYEIYTTTVFDDPNPQKGNIRNIHGDFLVVSTVDAVRQGFVTLQTSQVEPPLLVCQSLHNVKGSNIQSPDQFSAKMGFPRPDIFLPPVLFTSYEMPILQALKANFDTLWQANGHQQSPPLEKFFKQI